MVGSRYLLAMAILAGAPAAGCGGGSPSGTDDTWTDTGTPDAITDTPGEDVDPGDTSAPPDTIGDVLEEDAALDDAAGFVCNPPAAAGSLYELEADCLTRLETVSMCEFRGDVILIANIAALCGYTPQMGDLVTLQEEYGAQGLHVLGFYCDQFMHQAGNEEQRESCEELYGVNFLVFDIINVNPPGEHPIFTWLKAQPGGSGAVMWNFEKFLVSRDGELLGRWATGTNPTSTEIRAAIEAALAE